jgi:nitrous oxidase accessory protein
MRRRRLRAPASLAAVIAAGLSGPATIDAAAATAATPPPASCTTVAAGSDLASALAALPDGGTACLAPGDHWGPVVIDRRLAIQGPPSAVVHSRGSGSTFHIVAPGVALVGFSVDGSGGRFDLLDAAVRVDADDARVEGLHVRNALFGILAEKSSRLRILDNVIEGQADRMLGMRGDAIRLWEVRDSRVERNRVSDGRDVVVWYSPGNRIAHNRIERGRYGVHLMYSHGNRIVGNSLVGNVVGLFLMYSRNVEVRGNLVAESGGANGMGLGAKESGGLRVVGNGFVGNTTGVYLDTSPLDPAHVNLFVGNAVRFSEAAVVFHGRALGNRFEGNRFCDDDVPVRVEDRGDARDAEWLGNEYGDYAGYDLDGDGTGDVPYELRSLSSTLERREPALAFFRGSVAMELVELVSRALPLFRTTTLLVDPEPRMRLADPDVPLAGG